ncbi:hypothetical protein BCON_0335g00120 [Botryotinia convoluta]|uniref:Uncharacterized protein n=1 Tax=Botryotinia convoluta TaxID=54673 RepID=A0A4Z1HBT3_9HELO|nr:hypothetical protein BCON_0335g00120 [Botryotinia convoluta]
MFTLKAFENWAVDQKDHNGDIITEQRINAAHKDLFEKHPKDLPMITRKMVMGFFKMEPLEFEKKYFPIIYAASMEVQRLEDAPKSTIQKSTNTTHLDAELYEYRQVCLHKTRGDLALALYKRNRLSAETYANFCLEYFDTSVDKLASPAKQQVLRYTSTSPPPSYAYELHDTPAIYQTTAMPAAEPSFTAELEAAPVKAKPILLPPPTKPITKIKASGGDTKFDAELREYKQVCLKTKGDLAYALYLRGRFSEEEYTKFCAEYWEGDIPK